MNKAEGNRCARPRWTTTARMEQSKHNEIDAQGKIDRRQAPDESKRAKPT